MKTMCFLQYSVSPVNTATVINMSFVHCLNQTTSRAFFSSFDLKQSYNANNLCVNHLPPMSNHLHKTVEEFSSLHTDVSFARMREKFGI